MTYRMGIVGVGGIAYCHGRAAREAPEAELAAICDLSEESLGRFGEAFGVSRRYTDLERMLHEEEIDILVVSTWGNSHADISIRAARTGRVKAILCEKPISSTAAECEAMIKTAEKNDVLLAEAFKFRHHPCHLKAKELIEAGEIGKIYLIRSTFSAAVDPRFLRPDHNWRFNREKRGGAVYDLGCYCIHHARFIAGSEPNLVHARGHYGKKSEVPEAVAVQLQFPGEVSAQCAFSFGTMDPRNLKFSALADTCGWTWPGTTRIARSPWKSRKTTGWRAPSSSRPCTSLLTSCNTCANVSRRAGPIEFPPRTA